MKIMENTNDAIDPAAMHPIAIGLSVSMFGTSGSSIDADNATMMRFSRTMKINPIIISFLGLAVGRTVIEE